MDHDKAVRVYHAIKAKKTELKKQYEAEIEKLDAQLGLIEGALLGSLQSNKVTSMRTAHGTFYRETIIKPTCTDWPGYFGWMAQENAFEGVQKRVSQSFVVDYLEANKDTPPPGISVFREHVARIRAS